MAHDEGNGAYVPGPLDELFPGLRRKADKLPALPVHPRVLRLLGADGARAIALLSFRGAQSARALHAALKPLLEAALLCELCAPAAQLADDYARLSELNLLLFARPEFDPEPALAPFALAERELAPATAPLLALARHEAQQLEERVADEPCALYRARASLAPHPLAAPLHAALLELSPRGPWGREPGRLARCAADWLAEQGLPGVGPTRAGIELLETLVVTPEAGVIRWIEPLIFQALCDLIAVLAAGNPALAVEWGVCEPDSASGLAPPPVLRVQRDGDTFHVPLAEHVLRWCIMPVGPAERVPTLGAWAEHEFA